MTTKRSVIECRASIVIVGFNMLLSMMAPAQDRPTTLAEEFEIDEIKFAIIDRRESDQFISDPDDLRELLAFFKEFPATTVGVYITPSMGLLARRVTVILVLPNFKSCAFTIMDHYLRSEDDGSLILENGFRGDELENSKVARELQTVVDRLCATEAADPSQTKMQEANKAQQGRPLNAAAVR